jgi:hypothetical protein
MSDFWDGYEPEPTKPEPMTKDELTEPLGCVVVRPLVANRATPPAQPAPVQEPVAWSVTWDGVHCGNFFFREGDAIEQRERLSLKFPNEKREVVPLYTTPPAAQRQWVGLTDELRAGAEPMFFCGAKWAERILKEKNNG